MVKEKNFDGLHPSLDCTALCANRSIARRECDLSIGGVYGKVKADRQLQFQYKWFYLPLSSVFLG